MGIGGFFKGLGKGLLKAAPFATALIPGIGPIAAGLIGGGAGAASGAMGGGGWKGALGGGIQGAATGVGGKMAAEDGGGLGPSRGFLGGLFGGGGGGGDDSGGGGGGNIMNAITPFIQNLMRPKQQQPSLSNNQGLPPYMMSMMGGGQRGILNRPRNPNQRVPRSDVGIGIGPSRRRREMRTPNLTFPIEQGANEALALRGMGPRIPTMY